MSQKPKILYLVTEDWYFWSHRLSLARAARTAGFEVLVATRVGLHGERIQDEGFRLVPISLRRASRNPFRELFFLAELARIYHAERPAIVHHVAHKPVLYGSLAARWTGVPATVNALGGLGFAFIADGPWARLRRRAMGWAYRLALDSRNGRVILQNADDLKALSSAGMVRPDATVLIRGSGVDLNLFRPVPESEGVPLVVMPARLLWDKGVREFVGAARSLREEGVRARFALVGEQDSDNPAAVPNSEIERWRAEGHVEVWGRRENMPEVLAGANIVCLPSYREGFPKALMEAAACGRALVATDVPGCREVVRPGENGILVGARDQGALARALRKLIEGPDLRREMGLRSRRIAEAEFSEKDVVERTLSLYAEMLGGRGRR